LQFSEDWYIIWLTPLESFSNGAYPMKKKILIILLAVFVILAIAISYLNAVYLPSKIKTILISTLEKQFQRKVTLGSLHYNLIKGIVIKNLTIYESPTLEEKPFLTIKEISFNLLYLSIFKSKTIIIPSVKIDSAQINLIRLKDNEWNLSGLNINPSAMPEPNLSFFVYRINFLNAKIYFEDRTLTPYLSKTIPNINGRAQLALPKNIKFGLEAKLSPVSTSSLLLVKGNFDLDRGQLTSTVNFHDINLLQFQPYFNLPFNIKSALAKDADFKIANQNKQFSISGRIETKNIEIDKTPFNIQADCFVNTQIKFDPSAIQNATLDGSIEISKAQATGVELLQKIDEIKGTLFFDRKEIKTEDLQGITNGTVVSLKATLTDLANPAIDAKIFTSPPLEKLSEIFSDRLKGMDFEVEGRSQLMIEIKGPLNLPDNLEIKGSGKITDTTLSLPRLDQPLKDISAAIEFNKTSLRWNKLSADYLGTTYVSDGFIENFTNPHLEFSVGSKLLSLSTKLDVLEKNLKFSQLEGKYLHSLFDFKGAADLSDSSNPFLDLTGNIKLDLQDLTQLLPNYKSRILTVKPTGTVNVVTILKGKLNNWRQWQLAANANSPEVSLSGLKLNNLNLNYNQLEESIKSLTLSASSYGGTVDLSATGILSEDNFPVTLNARIQDVDLAQLKKDTSWKEKPTAGKFSISAEIQGPLKNTNDLRGSGTLSVTEGNLGQLNLLKGLGALLFIPEFERIVFKEAGGDFTVRNGAIYTSNLDITSNEIALAAEGNLDFAGNMNFTVNAQLNMELIDNSPSLKKSITKFLSSATGMVVVKLTGNIQNPKYKVIPAAGEIIKKVKEFLFEDILR